MSDESGGAPGWIMTFADLMSLLMCFFVLLLSFSEMDVSKYKQIAGSMAHAFGVQREIKVREIPKGTSVIARHFSPGKPEPTTLDEIRQKTVDESKRELETHPETKKFDEKDSETLQTEEKEKSDADQQIQNTTSQEYEKVKMQLSEEISNGQIEVKTKNKSIVITIKEKGSFSSGSSAVHKEFLPSLSKVGEVLNQVEGDIHVAGHTDNVPIMSDKYQSNWQLSAGRAVSMISALTKTTPTLDQNRFVVNAFADTKPLVPNDSETNRARNRRVEITIHQSDEATERAQMQEMIRQELQRKKQEAEAIRQQQKAERAAIDAKADQFIQPEFSGFNQ